MVKNGKNGKESACNVGDSGSIPKLGRSPEERNDSPLQHPCLENFTDREALRATVHGVPKNWTQLSECLHPTYVVLSNLFINFHDLSEPHTSLYKMYHFITLNKSQKILWYTQNTQQLLVFVSKSTQNTHSLLAKKQTKIPETRTNKWAFNLELKSLMA